MRGTPVLLSHFDQQEHDLAIDISRIQNYKWEAKEDIEKPAKLEVHKWI